jgi:hypothetical protein
LICIADDLKTEQKRWGVNIVEARVYEDVAATLMEYLKSNGNTRSYLY